jgi:ParB family transcriptional regulator, chromosome partitioning protein
MVVELHELELRYEALRILGPRRLARLMSSMAQNGQQSAVVLLPSEDGYVLLDGYARVAACRELGWDKLEGALLDMPDVEALLMTRRLENQSRRSALEDGWFISELVSHHGFCQRTVAARLHRSVSWVSRRLSLVELLPESVQAAVRRGVVPAHSAMKSLVPLARANREHCERMIAALGGTPVSVRELERLYLGWRRAADEEVRERIVENPRLFLEAQSASQLVPKVQAGDPLEPLLNDLEGIVGLARRARRRVVEGLIAELDEERRALALKSLQGVHAAVTSMAKLLEEASDD